MSGGDGEVVVVSGGSRGLGRAVTLDLLEHGYRVATFSRTAPAPPPSDTHTGRFLAFTADATDAPRVRAIVREVGERWGRVDALVNNAAVAVDGLLTLTRLEDVRHAIAVNVEAAFVLAQACTKLMLTRRRGVLVNISSVTAVRGFAGLAPYSATKAALEGMTRALARELGPAGIRVNAILPGYMETEMTRTLTKGQLGQVVRRTPLGRLGSTDDMTGVIRFLLSDESRFLTGQSIVVDGGLTC